MSHDLLVQMAYLVGVALQATIETIGVETL